MTTAAPLPPRATTDVEMLRARVEGRAVLGPPSSAPRRGAGDTRGLLLAPVGLAAAVGATAFLGADPDLLGWAGLAATAGCAVTARAWVAAERRTARVDALVRNRFAVPTTAVAASTAVTGPSPAAGPADAPDDVEEQESDAADAPKASDTPSPRASRDVPGRAALAAVVDRSGRGGVTLAVAVAVALLLVLVAAVGLAVARPGVLTVLAVLGPVVLLVTHVRLLVVRSRTPVLGTGLLSRWADAALLRRDLRIRLSGTAATPALYPLAWHTAPGWWLTLGVAAVAVLVLVQVVLLIGLDADHDPLPKSLG